MTDQPGHHDTVLDVGDIGLAKTYAIALLDAAEDGGARLDEVHQQVSQLGDLLASMPELFDPLLPAQSLQDILSRALAGNVLPVVNAFVSILVRRGRLTLLPAIAQQLKRLHDRRDGKVEVILTTAHPLSDDQQITVKDKLEKSMKSTITLYRRVDPSLVGGAKVTVDGRTYDASVASGLRDIKQQSLSRLREQRRSEKRDDE